MDNRDTTRIDFDEMITMLSANGRLQIAREIGEFVVGYEYERSGAKYEERMPAIVDLGTPAKGPFLAIMKVYASWMIDVASE